MRRYFLLFALAAAMAQAGQVQLIDGSTRSKGVQVVKNGQPAQMESREVQVDLVFPDGNHRRAEILMLREPQSGLFWWRYQASQPENPGGILERFLADSMVFVTDHKVVGFLFDSPYLDIRESTERHSSMDEGQAAVLAALDRYRQAIENDEMEWFVDLNLTSAVDPDFFVLRGSATKFPAPVLREVSRSGDNWRVVLSGPNGDAAAVLVSDSYKLLGASPVN